MMHILQKYVDCLNCQDSEAIAMLFTENAYLHDAAQRPFGGAVAVCRGREEIRAFFCEIFGNSSISSELVVAFGRRAFYNVTLNRQLIPCVGTVIEENGLITELIVDPR